MINDTQIIEDVTKLMEDIEYVSVKEFSKLLGVCEFTVRRLIQDEIIDKKYISRGTYLTNGVKNTGITISLQCFDELKHWYYDIRPMQVNEARKRGAEIAAGRTGEKPKGTITWRPVRDYDGFEMLPDELLRLKQIRDRNGLTYAMGSEDGFVEQVGIGAY